VTASSDRLALVDSHVHLHAYDDWLGILNRAVLAGVDRIVAVGVDLPTSRWNAELAANRPEIVAAVGVHPAHLIGPVDAAMLDELEALASQPAVGLVGEIGIDTIEGRVDLPTQLAAFRAQLGIDRRVRKPVNLHLRGAVDEALAVMAESDPVGLGAICHYFVGDSGQASRLLEAGLLLSVGKPASRPTNRGLREALAWLPLDRLLLETDSYPLPGRSTEPADLPLVAGAVAELRGCAIAQVADATTGNFRRLLDRAR
jgi:TatD DNase family protein